VDSSSTWFYNDGTSSYPVPTNWSSGGSTVGPNTTHTIRYYTPPDYLPPIAEETADDDLVWLGRRVAEIEDYSRIAA
jgi:hypothetical protein